MSLHADVAVPAHDRKRLERPCRCVARPPLAIDRLEAMADGRLAYRLKNRWRDGTTHVVISMMRACCALGSITLGGWLVLSSWSALLVRRALPESDTGAG